MFVFFQDRIFWELQSVLNSSDRSPTMSDLADMKYMEAVIKEILRLYPSVPFIGRQIDEDFILGKSFVSWFVNDLATMLYCLLS